VYAILEGFKKVGMQPGDMGITENLMDARSLYLTPNSTTPYCMMELNVEDGPMVMEVPPGVMGPIGDAYFRWVTDVGLTGPDQGKGGKYLFVHTSYKGELPPGYFVVQVPTYRNPAFFRAFVNDGDIAGAVRNVKENFRLWMAFLEDYKNHGGRVTLGSDSGYIFKTYGFGYVREMELLQEAGFHPLEVLRSATFLGAEALGMEDRIGSVRVGKRADLVVTEHNPLQNFKVLYGTGHFRLGEDGRPTRVGGVRYTIKDGVVFDARELLADVRRIVSEAREAREGN